MMHNNVDDDDYHDDDVSNHLVLLNGYLAIHL